MGSFKDRDDEGSSESASDATSCQPARPPLGGLHRGPVDRRLDSNALPCDSWLVPLEMRAAVLFLYAAGLVGPCLSSCLAPAAEAKSHECCQGRRPTAGPAFAAPAKDCCASEEQAKPGGTALHAPVLTALQLPLAAIEAAALASPPSTVRSAVSPPLVLRI